MFKIKVATKTKADLVIKVKMLSQCQTLLGHLMLLQYSKRLLCKNIIAKGMKDTAKEVMIIGW